MADGTGARSTHRPKRPRPGSRSKAGASRSSTRPPAPHYQRRITELEQELEEAQERGDGEAHAAAREELDALITALTAAYGLAGRPRRSDPVERARKQ